METGNSAIETQKDIVDKEITEKLEVSHELIDSGELKNSSDEAKQIIKSENEMHEPINITGEIPVSTNSNDKFGEEPLSDDEVVKDEKKLSFCEEFKKEIVQLRWRMLILMCFMQFGQNFITDFPGSIGTGTDNTIQSKFVSHGKKYTQTMNLALYSVYSYPNFVLAFFGGLLIDKYLGLRASSLLFTTCIFVGSVIFYIGVIIVNYPLLVVGRFIYALGGESCTVASSALTARYFVSSKYFALAFSITNSAIRIFSSLTFMFSPLMANAWGIDNAVLMGAVACGISFLSIIIIFFVDRRAEARGIVVCQDMTETFNFKDILKLPSEIWILSALCVFGYCAIFTFNGFAVNFFVVKYGLSQETASLYVSLYTYSSSLMGLFVGYFIDRFSRYSLWLAAASGILLFTHIIVVTTPTPGYVISILLGLGLSLLSSSFWTAVPIVVNMNILGFSYGTITAIQNIGLATWPVISGVILDANTPDAPPQPIINGTSVAPGEDEVILPTIKGYRLVELFLVITAAVSLFLSILLLFVNRRKKGLLLSSSMVVTDYISKREEKFKVNSVENPNSAG